MEQRNLILAIVVSLAILMGFQFLFPPASPPPQPTETATEGEPAPSGSVPTLSGEPGAPGSGVPAAPARDQAIGISTSISIETATLSGSIALRGARIDDLTLKQYPETIEPERQPITLHSQEGSAQPRTEEHTSELQSLMRI